MKMGGMKVDSETDMETISNISLKFLRCSTAQGVNIA